MTLEVQTTHRLGGFSLDAAFSSDRGVTALFGKSGSGKTTLINIIAGLLSPDSGRIVLDGDIIMDSGNRSFTPPHQRRFGSVFQEARLFPHLSVRHNLTYGRWFAPANQTGQDFDRIVDLLGIEALLERAPTNLSGGEKQRIAIGRALLSSPRLLLMDEPLAALDEARKAEILPYLERLRDETDIPIVYVSHSVAEVTRLANRVVALEDGRVSASGDAATVLSLSALTSMIGRREAGCVIEANIEPDAGDDPRLTVIRAGETLFRVPKVSLPAGHAIRLHIAARDVLLAISAPQGLSALNIFEGRILEIGAEAQGAIDVRVDCGGNTIVSRVTAHSAERLALQAGMPIHVVIKSVALEQ
ncbi:molybdenum ABC transporter ATP-binding protein [Pararhizobium antarcticum]|uniref:Molybdenum ABC transporter ATP-binding protein n=1 Tax=Pararhizobium antarcticum TaxID=1798805 RepID=A0A657LZV0_9HYPH|nr:molybdenum ABC transporter ATP-binding protein [Pararhizobium antarcticum]OJF96539.1 molybdenum ABC transporter ATP-binding protein [Rhizobium sp. 58]OJG01456.1 molybdenum ABC transporter ATP-binding protein [Pararhizobium antarcticum]